MKEMQDEGARKVQEDEYRQMKEKHKKHEKPHHPMTKDQLEEVCVVGVLREFSQCRCAKFRSFKPAPFRYGRTRIA